MFMGNKTLVDLVILDMDEFVNLIMPFLIVVIELSL